jgi:heme-degrading monooxygenase HmoA
MFTRHVETTIKPGKVHDFSTALHNDVLPLLHKQPGFLDLVELVADDDTGIVISLSFWKTKEDAERYEREQYNTVLNRIKPFLLTPTPKVTTFIVNTSTVHRITAGMAA